MLEYRIDDIARFISGSIVGPETRLINVVLTDSRSSTLPVNAIFIALHGPNHDGHNYIRDLIRKGIKNFVVDQDMGTLPADISVIRVSSTLTALQLFAQKHREKYKGKVLGITGSNGKTIIKEWLAPILSAKYSLSKSPKSYNSQLGVALSILQADMDADILLLEAGISKPDEMEKLSRMIQPDYGLITNIGDAHQESFITREQKLEEKLLLFENSSKVFYSSRHTVISDILKKSQASHSYTFVCWGDNTTSDLVIKETCILQQGALIRAEYLGQTIKMSIPFQDRASIENLCHIWNIALDLGISNHDINKRVNSLEPIAMRMEQKEGINGCTLINDFYNSDFHSIENAIDLLFQQTSQEKKTLIISDILQTGESAESMISKLRSIIGDNRFSKLIGIGPVLHEYGIRSGILTESYPSTKTFMLQLEPDGFKDEAILLKGARRFAFEQISLRLEQKVHRTVLRINMPTLLNNLNCYRDFLDRKTKIMGMVKAFSYGSGSHEVARFLSHHQIDYLAVAFVDEGIILRQAGIKTPIMVMNPDYSQSDSIIEYQLEPEVFNLTGLRTLKTALRNNNKTGYPVHVKIDTGMHRLGFLTDQLDTLITELQSGETKTCSIFSHLAAAEEPAHDDFTHQQIKLFESVFKKLVNALGYTPIKHILNTHGIERFPEAQFDMVRLGIGLYGMGTGQINSLESPIQFDSYISQIHELEEGETIGYGRSGRLMGKSRIGIIPLGYADGFDRRLGHGNWSMKVGNQQAVTVGQICMDMCMIDLTEIEAEEGDMVNITSGSKGISEMAEVLKTIPYEILTGFSQRINRIYEFE